MKFHKIITGLTILMIIIINCNKDFSIIEHDKNNPAGLNKVQIALLESDNTFSFELFKEIAIREDEKNIFISPLSAAFALGMTVNGAAGTTEQVMQDVLGFNNFSSTEMNQAYQDLMQLLLNLDPEVMMEIANSIWYRQGYPVEKDFLNVVELYYDAIIRELDFSSADALDTINGWIEEKTHGLIQNMIAQIDPLTVMFLINTIYFKGTWTYEFDPKMTYTAQFIQNDETYIDCDMMRQTREDYQYLEKDSLQIIELPYGNEKYGMTVLLPHPSISPDKIIADMTIKRWNLWTSQLRKKRGTLHLPKFKAEYKIILNDALSDMGMGIAFRTDANFSRINSKEKLYISKVIHQSFVEVNEEGTEAVAATVVEIGVTSDGSNHHPQDFTMIVNRPFIYIIHEKESGALLFMGKLINPSQS